MTVRLGTDGPHREGRRVEAGSAGEREVIAHPGVAGSGPGFFVAST